MTNTTSRAKMVMRIHTIIMKERDICLMLPEKDSSNYGSNLDPQPNVEKKVKVKRNGSGYDLFEF